MSDSIMDDAICIIPCIGFVYRSINILFLTPNTSHVIRYFCCLYDLSLALFLCCAFYLANRMPTDKTMVVKPTNDEQLDYQHRGLQYRSARLFGPLCLVLLFVSEACKLLEINSLQSRIRLSAFIPLFVLVPLVWSSLLTLRGRRFLKVKFLNAVHPASKDYDDDKHLFAELHKWFPSDYANDNLSTVANLYLRDKRLQVSYEAIETKDHKCTTEYFETIRIYRRPLRISLLNCIFVSVLMIFLILQANPIKLPPARLAQAMTMYLPVTFFFTTLYCIIFISFSSLWLRITKGRLSFSELVILPQSVALLLSSACTIIWMNSLHNPENHFSVYEILNAEIKGLSSVSLFCCNLGLSAALGLLLDYYTSRFLSLLASKSNTFIWLENHRPWMTAAVYCVCLYICLDWQTTVAPALTFVRRQPFLILAKSKNIWTLDACSCWIAGTAMCIVLTELIAVFNPRPSNYTKIVMRKLYHVTMVIGFLPIILFDFDTSSIIACYMLGLQIAILIEISRVSHFPMQRLSFHIQRFFKQFVDQRDDRGIILAHIYLALGIGVPVVYEYFVSAVCSRPSDKIAASLGIVTVGIGDSASALFGYGGKPLPAPYQAKTWNGSIGFLVSCSLVVGYIFMVFEPQAATKRQVLAAFLSLLAASIFEATSKEYDNYFIALVALMTYRSFA